MLAPTPYTLNIGLHRNDGGADLSLALVLNQLRSIGASVRAARVLQSDSEPTAVITVDNPLGRVTLYSLSLALSQDCIAQADVTGLGLLAGPKAADWGPFNPAYFLTLDGTRLSDAMALAA